MKKYLSLLLLGLAVVLASGCYKNVRNVDPNDPNIFDPKRPPNPNNKLEDLVWNWSGTAPFSYFKEGVPKDIGNNPETDYWIPVNAYSLSLYCTDGETIDFELPTDAVANETYRASMYLTTIDDEYYFPESGAIKILVNNDEFVEGLFATTFRHPINGKKIRIDKGYFKIPKQD